MWEMFGLSQKGGGTSRPHSATPQTSLPHEHQTENATKLPEDKKIAKDNLLQGPKDRHKDVATVRTPERKQEPSFSSAQHEEGRKGNTVGGSNRPPGLEQGKSVAAPPAEMPNGVNNNNNSGATTKSQNSNRPNLQDQIKTGISICCFRPSNGIMFSKKVLTRRWCEWLAGGPGKWWDS